MEYIDQEFCVRYYPEFIQNSKEKILEEIMPEIRKKFKKRKDGNLYQKRYSVNYGKDYLIMFKGVPYIRKALKFGPELEKLKKRVEKVVGHDFDTCFVQYYLSGKIGIKRHRDAEVSPGKVIASISFGAKRKFLFERKNSLFSFELEDKSLFLIMPPTNSFWLHSLPLQQNDDWRISIIFRKTTSPLEYRPKQ